MQRYYYSDTVANFLAQSQEYILGILAKNNLFDLNSLQRNTWISEIELLKRELKGLNDGTIVFEYTIPRIGKRIDNVLIHHDQIFLLEFKVGESEYTKHATEQIIDYALDLKNFHKESHSKTLIPILVSTCAPNIPIPTGELKSQIHNVIYCNSAINNLRAAIDRMTSATGASKISAANWLNSIYMPTPTIIEAAQALYRGHNVEDISRNDASAINLNQTTTAINKIIEDSKKYHKKSICFITGVPGAGKTLAGLNIANARHNFQEEEHAVFLSGNGPLVEVLQEALARDQTKRDRIKKSESLMKAKAFIQNIHHFRDDAIAVTTSPVEKVAIFDEAQRAWNAKFLCNFMTRKKGVTDFKMSEPEFLINIMNRHQDWAVIICLVGGGQEINTGEAGISEWFNALKQNYPDWHVYISDRITDSEYSNGNLISDLLQGINYQIITELHLGVSLRSFRSENVSKFIKVLLDGNYEEARKLYLSFAYDYPISITRDLNEAKNWIRAHAKGTERYGMIAYSGAKRLKPYGIWVQNKIDAPIWFLNDMDDIRSSYQMEDTSTEFDIQGLELDWTLMAWDANLRLENDKWTYYDFSGTNWHHVTLENVTYLKNAYRVLLTRARQGMVIFIPYGDSNDATRKPEWYDNIYKKLSNLLS